MRKLKLLLSVVPVLVGLTSCDYDTAEINVYLGSVVCWTEEGVYNFMEPKNTIIGYNFHYITLDKDSSYYVENAAPFITRRVSKGTVIDDQLLLEFANEELNKLGPSYYSFHEKYGYYYDFNETVYLRPAVSPELKATKYQGESVELEMYSGDPVNAMDTVIETDVDLIAYWHNWYDPYTPLCC